MTSPSKVRDPKGYSMGDDLCEYLTKVGVPKTKVPPNKNFPKGIKVYTMHKYHFFICPDSVPGSYVATEKDMVKGLCSLKRLAFTTTSAQTSNGTTRN